MPVRVLRLIEYTYPDHETMQGDSARWQVPAHGTKIIDKKSLTIRSTILVSPFDGDEPAIVRRDINGAPIRSFQQQLRDARASGVLPPDAGRVSFPPPLDATAEPDHEQRRADEA